MRCTHTFPGFLALFLLAGAGPVRAAEQGVWEGGFHIPGVNGIVRSMVVHEGSLVIGGTFTSAGGKPVRNIARWDGLAWHPMGEGFASDHPFYSTASVLALAVYQGEICAAGVFTKSGDTRTAFTARWDGTSWQPLGPGMDDWVAALAVFDGELYAGGVFTKAGTSGALRISRWNGTSWRRVSSNINYVSVTSLLVHKKSLYAGGTFSEAGGVFARNVARWDGRNWHPLGAGIHGNLARVYALATFGDDLYAGGQFDSAGTVAARSVARWNGTEWSEPGGGLGSSVFPIPVVFAMHPFKGRLFVAGAFDAAGGLPVENFAAFDGTGFTPVPGTTQGLYALGEYDKSLIVGGTFTRIHGLPVDHIGTFDGFSWGALGGGDPVDGSVNAVAPFGTGFVAGGNFTRLGTVDARNIGLRTEDGWHPLGSGFAEPVLAVAEFGGRIVAAGMFTDPPGHVAAWNGFEWEPLGTGLNAPVRALAVTGGSLYAAGDFTAADGMPAARVARWDGISWSPVGGGFNGSVRALVPWQGGLAAGGGFTTADGVEALRIAAWDGVRWTAIGSGMNARVLALSPFGNRLAAGGDFSAAGGVSASRVALWDGTAWTSPGSGITGASARVLALAERNGTLFAGGTMSFAGGVAARQIAAWDGVSWNALDTGIFRVETIEVSSAVNALAVVGNRIVTGGLFNRAGPIRSVGLAVWTGAPQAAPTSAAPGPGDPAGPRFSAGPNPAWNRVTFTFTTSAAGPLRVTLFSVTGRRVADLDAGWSEAGTHRVTWDFTDAGGRPVPAGIYFARLTADNDRVTVRVVRRR